MVIQDPVVPKRTTFGFGIWKSVYVLPVAEGSAAIAQLVPHTFYAGGHPIVRLEDGAHKGFDVRDLLVLLLVLVLVLMLVLMLVLLLLLLTSLLHPLQVRCRVELWSGGAGAKGTVSVKGAWPGAVAVSVPVALPAGASAVNLTLGAAQTLQARLWHPNGHGEQVRYGITATFTPAATATAGAAAASTTTRTLGFRHVALVTVNDTDAATAAKAATQDGSGQLTMFFRVNGAPMYARGGNKIPMELLDGRMSAAGHRRLVQSAAEANFNMLRIWGGAIFEPRAFYDAADEFGVLMCE